MRVIKIISGIITGLLTGYLICYLHYKDYKHSAEFYKAKYEEADSLRLIYSTYIVDDEKLHEGCLKAGSYGNYKQTTN